MEDEDLELVRALSHTLTRLGVSPSLIRSMRSGAWESSGIFSERYNVFYYFASNEVRVKQLIARAILLFVLKQYDGSTAYVHRMDEMDILSCCEHLFDSPVAKRILAETRLANPTAFGSDDASGDSEW